MTEGTQQLYDEIMGLVPVVLCKKLKYISLPLFFEDIETVNELSCAFNKSQLTNEYCNGIMKIYVN